MPRSMKGTLAATYRALFATPRLYAAHCLALRLACTGLGMLNSNAKTNGEHWFLSNYGKSFRVILDIGANTGEFAEHALRCCPDASIYCFEPHPKSVSVLLERFINVSRVQVVASAVGASCGRTYLFDYSDRQGSEHASVVHGVIEQIHKASATSVPVDEISLDDFAARKQLDHVDFIKIDVEGNEGAVLQGAEIVISQLKPKAIQLEFNEMHLLSKYTLIELMDQLNAYNLYRLLPRALIRMDDPWRLENKIYAYQNLIALRRNAFPNA